MKRKLTLVTFLLICCVLFTSLSSVAATTVSPYAWLGITDAYWVNIDSSLEAYFNMMDEFSTDGKTIYPDSYGGAYVDKDGKLNVLIVKNMGAERIDYIPAGVKVSYVNHSLNELNQAADMIGAAYATDAKSFSEKGFVGYYVNEEMNCISVEVDERARTNKEITALEIDRTLDPNMIRFEMVTNSYNEESIGPSDYADGDAMNGTVGFPAEYFYGDDQGFVTAAHLINGVGSTVNVNGVAGTVTHYQLSGTVDACFVKVINATNYLTSAFTYNGTAYKIIAANQYNYPQNTVVEKFGITTGYKTGSITSNEYVSTVDGAPTLTSMYRSNFGTGGTARGDSGAALLVPMAGNNKILIGLHVRGNGQYSSACKYVNVRDALSVNLYVD